MTNSLEKRYNVVAGRVSRYTDDPREALEYLDRDPEKGWCNEGYADAEDIGPGHPQFRGISGTMYDRRVIGPVSREQLLSRISTLEYEDFHDRVRATIKALT